MSARPFLLAASITIVVAWSAGAQRADSLPSRAAWFDVGIGPGAMPQDIGLIVSTVSVGIERPRGQLVMGRLQYGEEFCILGCIGEEASKSTEFGVLYGFISRGRWITVTAAGGLAMIHASRYAAPAIDGSWSSSSVTTLGIPAEMAVVVTPTRSIGLSLTGRLDVNAEASLRSIELGIRLGRLVPKAAP